MLLKNLRNIHATKENHSLKYLAVLSITLKLFKGILFKGMGVTYSHCLCVPLHYLVLVLAHFKARPTPLSMKESYCQGGTLSSLLAFSTPIQLSVNGQENLLLVRGGLVINLVHEKCAGFFMVPQVFNLVEYMRSALSSC
jgi:hypothetical protein